MLQDAVKRVDLAFDGFFRRCANGEKPGYPRYKSHFRYESMTFKQYGNSFAVKVCEKKNRGTLILAKLGRVKMVMHRPLQGTPKTAIVKRTPTGKWFVSIYCEDVEPQNRPFSDSAIGVDVGLKTFAHLSDGTTIENPRFFRAEEKNLAKAQRKRDKAPKNRKNARNCTNAWHVSMNGQRIAARTLRTRKRIGWSSSMA